MSSEFDLEDLKSILQGCDEYEPGHHLGRPFMSAYQIAIRFQEKYPKHPLAKKLTVGGVGTGEHKSLAQRIARFLSQAIKNGETMDIEGGFLSHDQIETLSFCHKEASDPVCANPSEKAHSILRVKTLG